MSRGTDKVMKPDEQDSVMWHSDGERKIFGNGLIQLVLGAVILWVGQTTFEHAGMLASIQNQVTSLSEHDDKLSLQYNRALQQLTERTKSRFTREDAEKLNQKLESLSVAVNDLKIQVHGLKMHDHSRRQIAALEVELQQLRAQLSRDMAATGYPTAKIRAAELPTVHHPVGQQVYR